MNDWISVLYRLPTAQKQYLVMTLIGVERATYIVKKKKFGVGDVTHWKEIPEHLKEEK